MDDWWSGRASDADDTFTSFVQATGAGSLRLAVLLAGDVAAGQDLLQSVHEQLYKRWRRHGPPEQPTSYVRTALINAASKWRRQRRMHREQLVEDPPEVDVHEIGADVLLRQHLLPALRALPPGQRAVLVLRYFADLTESATAAELGCSIGTVKSQASRALRRLREDPHLASAVATMEA